MGKVSMNEKNNHDYYNSTETEVIETEVFIKKVAELKVSSFKKLLLNLPTLMIREISGFSSCYKLDFKPLSLFGSAVVCNITVMQQAIGRYLNLICTLVPRSAGRRSNLGSLARKSR